MDSHGKEEATRFRPCFLFFLGGEELSGKEKAIERPGQPLWSALVKWLSIVFPKLHDYASRTKRLDGFGRCLRDVERALYFGTDFHDV